MKNSKIYLADIAGYHEEKEEAIKLIDILKNFDLYKEKGASIPKGLLLCGEPGVGKTMFAKAISNEAGVPLFEFETGESENEEEAVKGLKDLFAKAKETIPSIVFIDELDELISSTDDRGFYGFQSDYSRKTLKALLTEIDGISTSDGILVIATTNNKRTTPQALIRSGRLEKQITFELPSAQDRKEIIELYLKNSNVESISSTAVARKTGGFTGADIKSLVNSSIIEAIRRKEDVSMQIIESVIPTIRYGEIKKRPKWGPEESVCYHEIGHFLTQYGLTGEIGSISVEKFGRIAGRVEIEDEVDEPERLRGENDSADEVLDDVAVCLGGIAGEEVFLGKRFCGSEMDIKKAINLINVVMANGCLGFEMLPQLGIKNNDFLPSSIMELHDESDFSRDAKIAQILYEKLDIAISLAKKNIDLGKEIFPLLKERGYLSKDELTVIVNSYEKRKDEQNEINHPID